MSNGPIAHPPSVSNAGKPTLPPSEFPTERQSAHDQAAAALLSRPPLKVPGFELVRELGSGSFGDVYLARDRAGTEVGIKFFTRGDGTQLRELWDEIRVINSLGLAPHVIQVKDANADFDPPFYVMPYAKDGSLAQRIAQGPMSPPQALRLFKQIVTGMAAVHQKGIIHCDLKPQNILLYDEQAWVADFGQAQLSSDLRVSPGTFYYMAPEQADPEQRLTDFRWDVYALGALLYAMLTGGPPRRTKDADEQLSQTERLDARLRLYRKLIVQAPAPQAHHHIPGVSRGLARLIDRCLAVEPSDRPSDARALLSALAAIPQQRRRQRVLLAGLLVPIVALLLFFIVGYRVARDHIQQADVESAVAAQARASMALPSLQARFAAFQSCLEQMALQAGPHASPESADRLLADYLLPSDLTDDMPARLTKAWQTVQQSTTNAPWKPTDVRWLLMDRRGIILGRYELAETSVDGQNTSLQALPLDNIPQESNPVGGVFCFRDYFSAPDSAAQPPTSTETVRRPDDFCRLLWLAHDTSDPARRIWQALTSSNQTLVQQVAINQQQATAPAVSKLVNQLLDNPDLYAEASFSTLFTGDAPRLPLVFRDFLRREVFAQLPAPQQRATNRALLVAALDLPDDVLNVALPVQSTHLSKPFASTADGRVKFSISVPIFAGGSTAPNAPVVGVLSVSIPVDQIAAAFGDQGNKHVLLLNQDGQVLYHSEDNVTHGRHWQESHLDEPTVQQVISADPSPGDSDVAFDRQRFLDPITGESFPFGWQRMQPLPNSSNQGAPHWALVVLASNAIERLFLGLSTIALLFAAALIAGEWLILRRALSVPEE